MKKLIAVLAVLFTGVAGILIPTPPASAQSSTAYLTALKIVYVEDHTGLAWPVSSAYAWVDQYTGSDWVYGTCRQYHVCIRVKQCWFGGSTCPNASTSWAAYTVRVTSSYYGGLLVTVRVNTARNGNPYSWRWRYVAHELVHAGGYWQHWPYCTDLMYYRVPCWGTTLPPVYIHAAVRSVLAQY